MRKLPLFLVLIFFIGAVSCQTDNKTTSHNLLSLVPHKTAVILRTNDLQGVVEKLKQNSFIKANEALPFFQYFTAAYQPITKLELSERSLLCFSKIGPDKVAVTLVTPTSPRLLDSVGYKKVEGYTYNKKPIKVYTLGQQTIYGAKLNGIFVFGNSKLVVENMVRLAESKIRPSEALLKLYTDSDIEETAVFINVPQLQEISNGLLPNTSSLFLKRFTNWVSLDLDIRNKGFRVKGISRPDKDEVLGLLQGTSPRKNTIAQITPLNALGFYSFTFEDFEPIKSNLSFYRKELYPTFKVDLLADVHEVGEIFSHGSTVLVLNSTQPQQTEDILNGMGQQIGTHRGYPLYSFSKSNYFYSALQPLIKLRRLKYYTRIGHFFVFGKSQSSLENIISNVQNETVLAQSQAYRKTTERLDAKSSLLLVGIPQNLVGKIQKSVGEEFKDDYQETQASNYHYTALQFMAHEKFVYINGVLVESEAGKMAQGAVQKQSIKVGEKVIAGPWFFVNWRTGHYDIVVQGESNTLYTYNEDGELRWKKTVDGPILGDIQPIDIYQNTRIQMAFVTPYTFYIIDRDGNIVDPFNKTFENTITQPLAIFDYYDSGRFRFIITQKNRLSMLNKQLAVVEGFEFTATDSPVLHAPKHFRIGKKDYIVVAEESGQLHILSVSGQTRVEVKETIDFSDNEWYVYNKQFSSTNRKGQLVQIDQAGNLQKKDLELGENNRIAATPTSLVTFSGNKLTINGKRVTLDYGLYTAPEIFSVAGKRYITITDKQAHRVYLFDSSAKLLPGFPVYGNSTIDIKNMDNRGGLELVVKGEEDAVLVYELE